jgi:hypothetical protein
MGNFIQMKILFIIIPLLILFSIASAQKVTKSFFDKSKPFKIISSKKGITKQSSSNDTLSCTNWNINRKFLPQIIRNSNYVNGTELDLTFEFLPCIIIGEIKQKDKIFKFEINAGSWMYIKSNDTTIILGNYQKANQKYFLSNPYIK